MLCTSSSVELLLSMPKQLLDDHIQHQLIGTCAGRFVRKSLKGQMLGTAEEPIQIDEA